VGAVVSNKEMFKLKKAFAKNVTAMHDPEVFGIGCNKSWNCLLKDYVILDVLETYKKKCYNPCFDFETVTFLSEGTGIFLVVDDFNFDLVVGDELDIVSESLELLDTSTYTITSITPYSEMSDEDKTAIDDALLSQNSFKIELNIGELVSETEGSFSLTTPKEIIFEDRELLQEDINCLIEKTC